MHRLHQNSILILVTFLLSTSSLSGCSRQVDSRYQFKCTSFVASLEISPSRSGSQKDGLQEERPTTISSARALVKKQACTSASDKLQQIANDASLTELKKFALFKKVAFQAATKEAQRLGTNLSKTQLQRIAQEVALAFLHSKPLLHPKGFLPEPFQLQGIQAKSLWLFEQSRTILRNALPHLEMPPIKFSH